MHYEFVFKHIPLYRSKMIFAPGNIGCRISELSFEIKRNAKSEIYVQLKTSNDFIIDYLNISDADDMINKISAYLIRD